MSGRNLKSVKVEKMQFRINAHELTTVGERRRIEPSSLASTMVLGLDRNCFSSVLGDRCKKKVFPRICRHRGGSERRFYDGHDRKVDGSTPTQAPLLRSWISCFTIIISTWWNLTSNKSKKSRSKTQPEKSEKRQLLSESGFVLCAAPPSFSRDKRIKMKKSSSSFGW